MTLKDLISPHGLYGLVRNPTFPGIMKKKSYATLSKEIFRSRLKMKRFKSKNRISWYSLKDFLVGGMWKSL